MFFFLNGFLNEKKKPLRVKKETIEGFNFKFQKHQFSRSIKMSIKENEVLVTLPKYATYKLAKEFVINKLDWVRKNYRYKSPKNDVSDLRKQAKKVLSKRLEELSVLYGFSYRSLRLTNAKKRWGSCSFVNNINLNINLVRLEDELIDYVILHELCHTKVKNHSKKFWDLVTSKMPDALNRRKKLKKIIL